MNAITRNITRLTSLRLLSQHVPRRHYKNPVVSEFYRQHSIKGLEERKRLLGLEKLPGDDSGTKYTEVEESTAEWKFVERLIPPLKVPTPPKHQSYPTPTGWAPPPGLLGGPEVIPNMLIATPLSLFLDCKHPGIPNKSPWKLSCSQSEKSPNPKYHVRRDRLLGYPVKLEVRNGQTRLLTVVKLIEGDIWALEHDIRAHLENIAGKRIHTQVHEVAGFIRFKGDYVAVVKQWLQHKGF